MLKKILYVVGALVAVILIIPVFLSESYTVSRKIEISKPDSVVFQILGDFNEFPKWSPWNEMDSTITFTVSGTPDSIGHLYTWSGQKMGEGSMQFLDIIPNKVIKTDLIFISPNPGKGLNEWLLEPTEAGTQFTWTVTGELGYFGRYFGLVMDSMLGKDFERGQSKLKALAESK